MTWWPGTGCTSQGCRPAPRGDAAHPFLEGLPQCRSVLPLRAHGCSGGAFVAPPPSLLHRWGDESPSKVTLGPLSLCPPLGWTVRLLQVKPRLGPALPVCPAQACTGPQTHSDSRPVPWPPCLSHRCLGASCVQLNSGSPAAQAPARPALNGASPLPADPGARATTPGRPADTSLASSRDASASWLRPLPSAHRLPSPKPARHLPWTCRVDRVPCSPLTTGLSSFFLCSTLRRGQAGAGRSLTCAFLPLPSSELEGPGCLSRLNLLLVIPASSRDLRVVSSSPTWSLL